MGIYAQLIDYDEEFASLPFEPVVVNDYDTSNPDEKEQLDRHLYTHYQNTDTIEEAAACDCGAITGVYNLDVLCDICNTTVQGTTDKPIHSVLWIRAPDGVPSLFSPAAWMILEPALRVKEFNFLDYLTNTGYRCDLDQIKSRETRKKIDRLIQRDLPRGFSAFVTHFDEIIDFLFSAGIIDSNKANKGELWEFIQQNKHLFFPKHLPLPSKICFVIESTTSGIYIDKPLGMAMDAVLTMASIRSSKYPLKPAVVQNRVAKTIRELAAFYDVYTKKRVAQKPGMIRRHVLGSRLHFTGRGVITSLSDPHDYDEIHIPWGMAAQLFKYHIVNKLLKRGYSANQALEFVYSNVLRYNPVMDEIFQELIAEAPLNQFGKGGVVCSLARNPTLQRGSMQYLRITKVKTDVHVNTISLSVGVLAAPNAD